MTLSTYDTDEYQDYHNDLHLEALDGRWYGEDYDYEAAYAALQS